MTKGLGYQSTIDFYDCDKEIIDSVNQITIILEEGAKMMNLSIVNTIIHEFSPIGISGVVVIKESHIAIHTWPEYGFVALDFFTCNENYDLTDGIHWIKQKLKASSMEVNLSKRGDISKIKSFDIKL